MCYNRIPIANFVYDHTLMTKQVLSLLYMKILQHFIIRRIFIHKNENIFEYTMLRINSNTTVQSTNSATAK